MNRIWSNELELQFLEYLQTEPSLWNPNLKDYKNKFKIHDAWKRISTLMDIPIDELKIKKNSLLASYRGYKNRVKKSQKSGAGSDDIYQPIWFAYEYMDSFLGDTTKCKNTVNTVTQSANSEDHEEQLDLEKDQSAQSPQTDDQNQRDHRNTTAAPTIRRRKYPTELSEAGQVMKEALSTFNATIKRNESQLIPKEDDDCDLYAKLMAKKLRRLPEDKRLRLMHTIDGLFLSSQYSIDSESSSPIPTPSPQSCNSSYDQYQPRPGTSFSSHSEPIMHHSATPLQQPQHAKAIHFSPVHIQNSNALNRYLSSNVIIQSNDVLYPPVIHIPEQNTNAETNTVMTNEDTALGTNTNIIEEAFLSS